jgi:hypothetical protein
MRNEEDYQKLKFFCKVRLQQLEERFNLQIQAKDREIAIYKSQIEVLRNLFETHLERPITIQNNLEAKTVTDQSNAQTRNVSFNAPIQGTGYAEGDSYYYASPEQKQSLVEAAAEIQKLLEQLSQTYPSSTAPEQIVVAAKAIEEIEDRPELKQRIIEALRLGGSEALKEMIDNPVINVLLAAIEGWRSAK